MSETHEEAERNALIKAAEFADEATSLGHSTDARKIRASLANYWMTKALYHRTFTNDSDR